MKYFVLIVLLSCSIVASAQVIEIEKLHKALLEKDSLVLDALLHSELSYGHSNGLVESKLDVYKNLKTKKIQYHTIAYENLSIQTFKRLKITRYNMIVNVEFENKNYNLKLHCLQTWLKYRKSWKLIARQATKITS